MSKVVLVLDAETTGNKPETDQIIELALQEGIEVDAPCWTKRFRPAVPISPEAQEKHGIAMGDLEGCKPFARYAKTVRQKLEAADVLVGYNLRKFDLPLLQAEFLRAGVGEADIGGKLIVDVYCLWQNCEPRTLEVAHRRFVGHELQGAHGSECDTRGTVAVLKGMVKAFDIDRSWKTLAKKSATNWIGPSPQFIWEKGVAVLNFSKHRGLPLNAVDTGFFRWMLDKGDFPPHAVKIAERLLALDDDGDLCEASVREWLVAEYGPPPVSD